MIVSFMRRLFSAYFAQTIIRFPKMFCPQEVISFQSCPKKMISESNIVFPPPQLPFLIFVFIVGSLNKMKVLPLNMVGILCTTFCDCSVYNFTSLFFFYWIICPNECTFFLVQQLDDVMKITSECFNFKRKLR